MQMHGFTYTLFFQAWKGFCRKKALSNFDINMETWKHAVGWIIFIFVVNQLI